MLPSTMVLKGESNVDTVQTLGKNGMRIWMLPYIQNVFNLFLIKINFLGQKMGCEIKFISLQETKSWSQLVGTFRDSWQYKMLQERYRI